jgi:hypothetical protein
LALLLLLGGFAYGIKARLRWTRAQEELRSVRKSLSQLFGDQSHRQLFHSSEGLLSALLEVAETGPQAQAVLDELIPIVREYHGRAMANGSEAWEEVRDSFLEQERHPIRVVKGAAGWVVLLGLAGTVLGFGTAMPALRNVLTAPNTVPSTAASSGPSESVPDRAVLAGQRLSKVLNSLEGVFSATFAGVFSALLLSILGLVSLEPAFNRYSREVDLLGARWFVPLIHAPDTLVDDALRSELKVYFERVSERLEAVLHPLIRSLSVGLEQMSGLATDFSGNIRMGVSTLETFRDAVARLGGSAEGAVEQLVKIVDLSVNFVRELETLQEKGAKTLAVPAERLAGSAAAIDGRIEALDGRLASLGDASRDIAKIVAASQAGIASLPVSLQHGLKPLFEMQANVLLEGQGQSAKTNREALSELTVSTQLLRNLVASTQGSSGREEWVRDLGAGLAKLDARLADLPDRMQEVRAPQKAQEGGSSGTEAELFRILRDIRVSLAAMAQSRPRPIVQRESSPPLSVVKPRGEARSPSRWQVFKLRLSRVFAWANSSKRARP